MKRKNLSLLEKTFRHFLIKKYKQELKILQSLLSKRLFYIQKKNRNFLLKLSYMAFFRRKIDRSMNKIYWKHIVIFGQCDKNTSI